MSGGSGSGGSAGVGGASSGNDRGAWIAAWATIVAAAVTAVAAVATPLITKAVAESAVENPAPKVRIDEVSWREDNHEFGVTGEVIGLQSGEAVWLFSSRADGEGGVHPAHLACSVASDEFACNSWAGDAKEVGMDFTIVVAVVSEDDSGNIRANIDNGIAYDHLTEIPAVDGTWTTHSIEAFRPAP